MIAEAPPPEGAARVAREPVVPPPPAGILGARLRWAVLAVAMVAAGGGALLWALRAPQAPLPAPAEVPLIRAEARPVKERPKDPGGMKVEFRDKLVYRRLQGEGPPPTVERLLPPPEEPLPPPRSAAPKAADQAATEPPALELAAKEEAPPALTPPPLPPGKTGSQVKEDAGKDTGMASVAKAVAAASAAKGGAAERGGAVPYRVQLAAVRSRAQAEAEWKRLSGKYPDILASLELHVARADLGAKGVFYRLRAGPLHGQQAARRVCDALAKRKVGCLIVPPGG